MSGYTPVFDTVLDGTLFGKWPHTGVWLCLLSQCDRRGHINMVPQLLAAKIGLPLQTLLDCIQDFMGTDPGSRTPEDDGRRLERLDVSREWGWKVINHGKYRERARKKTYDDERTASGHDAERKQALRVAEKEVPRVAANSRAVPLSDADADADADATPNKEKTVAPAGLDVAAWDRWVEYRKVRKPALKAISLEAAMREMAALGDGQMAAVQHSIANGWQGLIAPKGASAPAQNTTKFDRAMEALDRA